MAPGRQIWPDDELAERIDTIHTAGWATYGWPRVHPLKRLAVQGGQGGQGGQASRTNAWTSA